MGSKSQVLHSRSKKKVKKKSLEGKGIFTGNTLLWGSEITVKIVVQKSHDNKWWPKT